MKIIQISEDVQFAKTYEYVVSAKEYKLLEKLEFYGGFRRFNFAIYDDNAKGRKSTFNCLKTTLSKVFNANIDNILMQL